MLPRLVFDGNCFWVELVFSAVPSVVFVDVFDVCGAQPEIRRHHGRERIVSQLYRYVEDVCGRVCAQDEK